MTSLETLLPHRAPMILLSEVKDHSLEERFLTASVIITEDTLFYEAPQGGVPAYVALEYMAQAIGCFAGYYDLSQTPPQKPGVGFVLGSRRFEAQTDVLEKGTYLVRVEEVFFDEEVASFDCFVYDDKKNIRAHALLNAYRPKNITDFTQERIK